ncbi:MAG: GtrA family protein [Lachnospiraceae bacterium]|nr:GtrA family protein [Lachnospiraceae bacterium]
MVNRMDPGTDVNEEQEKLQHDRKVKKEIWRTVKFVLLSLSAGLIQIGSFTLMNEVFHWPYWVSYLIALILSVVWNFTLNRKFTFKSVANVPVAMLKVAAFYAVFTPLSTWLEDILAGQLGWNEYLVTLINMFLNFVLEYLYWRFVVFGKTIDTNEQAKKEQEKEREEDEKRFREEAEAKNTKTPGEDTSPDQG